MDFLHFNPDQRRALGLHAAAAATAEEPPPWDGPPASAALKAEPEEGCPVCGDKVSGYHYGLLTCESCKGFFKRSVQNNKRYTCAEHQRCTITLSQRKRCPSCRFQKCLSVGMKQEAVRADRMRGGRNKFGPLYRRDRQMKQQRACHRTSSAHHKTKRDATQTLHHPLSAPLSADIFHHHMYRPGPVQPAPLDCCQDSDRLAPPPPRALPPPRAPPYPGLQHQMVPVFLQEEAGLSYGTVAANYQTPQQPAFSLAPPCPSTSAPPPAMPPSQPTFISLLLEGEQDERELSATVLASLQREQASRGKHDRLNTFSIMCKMAEQTLLALVQWARRSLPFTQLQVEDQMVLLQSCWSELLVLDHLCRQVTYGKDGCIYLVTGQQIELSTVASQAGAALSSLVTRTQELVSKMKLLQLDPLEFTCLKYLVLFNPDVKSVRSRQQVELTQERVNRVLLEHTHAQTGHAQQGSTQPGHAHKFGQLLLRLPEVRGISLQLEEYLYQRHLLGDLPCNSLLTEMLHAKHS